MSRKYYLTYTYQVLIVSHYSHLRKREEEDIVDIKEKGRFGARKSKKKGGEGKEETDKLRGPERDAEREQRG